MDIRRRRWGDDMTIPTFALLPDRDAHEGLLEHAGAGVREHLYHEGELGVPPHRVVTDLLPGKHTIFSH